MKKILYSLAILALAVVFMSCGKDDNHDIVSTGHSIEDRARSLGFSDANAYTASVAQQCAIGNHENCDILNNGIHQVCGNAEHLGNKHDGTHHNGMNHGADDALNCTDTSHNHGGGNKGCNQNGVHHN
ncbi:MAG: hypothetical protein RL662_2487 [Bacteroidota bacterium]|jgi:hypothetical protein